MTERAGFPPPPIKSIVTNRDGTMALAWQTWFGALSGWIQRVKVVAAAVDLPSIPANGGWWGQVSVVGARRGDFALAALDPADRDLAVSAQVTADDTVTVWVRNHGAVGIDLGAGTLRVRVEKGR
jgi:hypothetical protein